MDWYENALSISENDKSIVISAPGFDLTQKNIFAFLRNGASLVFPNQEVFDPTAIRKIIETEQVTHINCAPSAFYALLEGGESAWQQLSSLRWVVLGGENILSSELSEWYQSAYCQAQIMNSYGPTECSDVVSSYILKEKDFEAKRLSVPAGKAINNTNIYIVNDFHQVLPAGLLGEVAIGGACLGLGYLDQPKLNKQQFIDIKVSDKEERVYLSGDLGRINSRGELEILGRKDFQVKLRGQRIELNEIEYALRTSSIVRDALVVVEGDYLIAYITKNTGDDLGSEKPSDNNILQAELIHTLPAYMLPSQIISLDKWPLNSNGKIDRSALPKMDLSLSLKRDIILPSNDIEQALADIWCEVLGIDEVSINDNFFELGGHSLLATKVVSRLKEHFKIEFPLKALFDLHTIAGIAEYIKTLLWAIESKDLQSKSSVTEEKRDEGFL